MPEREATGASPDQMVDPYELRRFLVGLGSRMTAAGDSVDDVELRLRRVAGAYGAAGSEITVLPTFLVLALGPGDTTTIERTRTLAGPLRLDQAGAVFELVAQAERREVEPAAGIRRLTAIDGSRARFGRVVTLAGHVVLTVGVCLILQPTWLDIVVAAGFGAFVGVLTAALGRSLTALAILPALAAFTVSALTFTLADHGWIDTDLRAMVASLISFVPGAALTTGVVELAAGEMVAGSSRLVAGAAKLLLLAFGIVAGALAAGGAARAELVDAPQNLLGWWAPWLGVLVFGIGAFLAFSAPRGSVVWLLVVLYAAWLGQLAGSLLFGGYLSGFVGALVMTPVAYAVSAVRSGPPVLVTFLPAFWLLVPGALGLIGATDSLGQTHTAGLDDFVATIGAIVSVALGVLCGTALYRSVVVSKGRFGLVGAPAR